LVKYKQRHEPWIHKIDDIDFCFSEPVANYLNDQERIGQWLDFSKINLINFRKNLLLVTADIIHLHNLHGGFFSYALLPYLSRNKKVIWTLHDEHAITGHCSFSMKCDQWKNNCLKCDFLEIYPSIKDDNAGELLKFKKRWIKNSNLTFVTPSKWLSDRLKVAYPFLQNIHVIPNGIDLNIFDSKKRSKDRSQFNLPENKFLVLFIAEYSTNNPFKGGEYIRKLIDLNTNFEVIFVTIGGNKSTIESKFIEIPYINDEIKLADLYSICDLMLYPTNADNHPLVVMEAMACKLPVLAPKIGGVSEIISNEVDGWLVESYVDISVYQSKLNEIYDLKLNNNSFFQDIRNNARRKIEQNFSLEKMLSDYKKLYESL
jgi:glycosyltransferase involved in cell wall biosynthesis